MTKTTERILTRTFRVRHGPSKGKLKILAAWLPKPPKDRSQIFLDDLQNLICNAASDSLNVHIGAAKLLARSLKWNLEKVDVELMGLRPGSSTCVLLARCHGPAKGATND